MAVIDTGLDQVIMVVKLPDLPAPGCEVEC